MTKIAFGTDGWRGIISDTFTTENLELISMAIGNYFQNLNNNKCSIVIGYDTRFMSEIYASKVAEHLKTLGVDVLLANQKVSTPALSFAVKYLKATAGIMITASHNPYYYNGVKIKEAYGGSAKPETTIAIETFINNPTTYNVGVGSINLVNLNLPYLSKLRTLCNFDKISGSKLKVVVDSMYGSTSGYLTYLFENTDLNIIEINSVRNPYFGGINPEPIDTNLYKLKQAVIEHQAHLGVAFDGDGDRIGAVDHHGNFVSPQQLYPLLIESDIKNCDKPLKGVGKTFSTSELVNKICNHYDIPVHETPIGFKYQCQLFLDNKIDLGGEESGGFGYHQHLPERDGVLSCLKLLEFLVTAKKSLATLIRQQQTTFGNHFYNRIDLPINSQLKQSIISLLNSDSITKLGEHKIIKKSKLDGLKFYTNHGWLLLRFSGTEPLLRVYAEADSIDTINSYINYAKRLTQIG